MGLNEEVAISGGRLWTGRSVYQRAFSMLWVKWLCYQGLLIPVIGVEGRTTHFIDRVE